MADPLSADSLLERARTLAGNHDTATLKSPVQALALLSYAIHSQLDFRCLDQLDDDWIDKEGSNFKFKYRHDQSSLEFVVSIQDLAPSPRLLVAAAAHANDADARSSTLDISIRDYFSPSAFPCKVSDLSDQNPFAATHRFKDLVALYRINIVQKLLPGLNKSGYHELVENAARAPPLAAGSGTTYLPDAGGPMGMFPLQEAAEAEAEQRHRPHHPCQVQSRTTRSASPDPAEEAGETSPSPISGEEISTP